MRRAGQWSREQRDPLEGLPQGDLLRVPGVWPAWWVDAAHSEGTSADGRRQQDTPWVRPRRERWLVLCHVHSAAAWRLTGANWPFQSIHLAFLSKPCWSVLQQTKIANQCPQLSGNLSFQEFKCKFWHELHPINFCFWDSCRKLTYLLYWVYLSN